MRRLLNIGVIALAANFINFVLIVFVGGFIVGDGEALQIVALIIFAAYSLLGIIGLSIVAEIVGREWYLKASGSSNRTARLIGLGLAVALIVSVVVLTALASAGFVF